MKLKTLVLPFLAASLLAVDLTACVSARDDQAGLAAQAKIAQVEAAKIALAKVPGGTLAQGELEREDGKLIWSFDIAMSGPKDVTEVQVDALNGEVVSVQKEIAAEEAKEKQEKRKEKH